MTAPRPAEPAVPRGELSSPAKPDLLKSPTTVAQALSAACALGLDRLDAQILLAAALDRPRSWLLAHDEAALDAAQAARFAAHCARRSDGEPVAYVLGEKEFHGLMLRVDHHVLVPRPDTETLVDWAIELLAPAPARPAVADLGTGSGAIALALAHARPAAQVCGVDVSLAALAVARANGERHGLAVEWQVGDWWAGLGAKRFDMVVSNPPYIADGDPHLPALRHEPLLALSPGGDGLAALRILIEGAPEHLLPGGWLLLEHGHDQAEAVYRLLREHGFAAPAARHDLAGQVRCSAAQFAAGL